MVLVAVIVVGLMADIAVTTTSRALKADREAELIFRGQAYINAIASYYHASPLRKEFPRSLEDLLQDPRFPNKRHIRTLYADPMTGNRDWTLIRVPGGGITGVASKSKDTPLKKAGFPEGLESFEEAELYSEWIFEYAVQNSTHLRNSPTFQ